MKKRFFIAVLGAISLLPFTVSLAQALRITEIAAFEASATEWIEIHNESAATVDLTGWKFFENGTNHGISVFRGDALLDPGELAIIANKSDEVGAKYDEYAGSIFDSSWSSLSLEGEEIGLKNAAGELVDSFTYTKGSVAKTSLERSGNSWVSHPSSHSIGKLRDPAQASLPATSPAPLPVAPVQSSAQASTTTTGSAPTKSAPASSEKFEIHGFLIRESPEKLRLEGVFKETTKTGATAKIVEAALTEAVAVSSSSPAQLSFSKDIKISEVYPYPDKDEEEWVELVNVGSAATQLTGWMLADTSKANSPYIFPENTPIAPGGYIMLPRSRTRIALNNDTDQLVLADPQGTPIDAVVYKNGRKKLSYVRTAAGWQWTDEATPGKKNLQVERTEGVVTAYSSDSFELREKSGGVRKINISPEVLDPLIAESILAEDSAVSVDVKKEANGEYALQNITSVMEAQSSPTAETPSSLTPWLITGAIGLASVALNVPLIIDFIRRRKSGADPTSITSA